MRVPFLVAAILLVTSAAMAQPAECVAPPSEDTVFVQYTYSAREWLPLQVIHQLPICGNPAPFKTTDSYPCPYGYELSFFVGGIGGPRPHYPWICDDLLWDFGDGATSTEVSPRHTYAGLGPYKMTLTAKSRYGPESVVITKIITMVYHPSIPLSPWLLGSIAAGLVAVSLLRLGR